jgi:hypothetical protein
MLVWQQYWDEQAKYIGHNDFGQFLNIIDHWLMIFYIIFGLLNQL